MASFVGCHQFGLLERVDVLRLAAPGATFLLNSPHKPAETWDHLPRSVQQNIIDKRLRLFVIDASQVARDVGLGGRINTVLQTCFFAISGVLPRDDAVQRIKSMIRKTYGLKGADVVAKNIAAVDATLSHLSEVSLPKTATSTFERPPTVSPSAPDFLQRFTAEIMAGRGDALPVSAMPIDGTFPTGTAAWEKRNIADEVPVWETDLCIQCGQCALACPHSVIRARFYDERELSARDLQVCAGQCPGLSGQPLHFAILRGGLHRMRHVCGSLPGAQPTRPRDQGYQYGGQSTVAQRRAGEYRIL